MTNKEKYELWLKKVTDAEVKAGLEKMRLSKRSWNI